MKKKKLSEKENDEEEKDESKIDSFLHPIDASLTHLRLENRTSLLPVFTSERDSRRRKRSERWRGAFLFIHILSLFRRTFH